MVREVVMMIFVVVIVVGCVTEGTWIRVSHNVHVA